MLSERVQALIKTAQIAANDSLNAGVQAAAKEVVKWYDLFQDNEQDPGVKRMLACALADFQEALS